MFKGITLSIELHDNGYAEIRFNQQNMQVNTLNSVTLEELQNAIRYLQALADLKGVIITSAKDTFIVGADIYEFPPLFAGDPERLAVINHQKNEILTALEDLAVPTVTLLNGLALGGGFELALTTDYRIATADARAGLPEVGLGILPAFGGTVRLPRLVGASTAIDWIISGKQIHSTGLLEAGAIDAIAEKDTLILQAFSLLQKVTVDGSWKIRHQAKVSANQREVDQEAINALKAMAKARGKYYPAGLTVCELIEQNIHLSRDEALNAENQRFVELATTTTAQALIQLFINDQFLKKKSRHYVKSVAKVDQAVVLGAGIMGGGIAYTSAVSGTPIIMKDIVQAALDTGMSEANKLLQRQVKTGRLDAEKANVILQSIEPTLDFDRFQDVSFVVEAIVENLNVKKMVVADVESRVREDTVIASNTSSLSIAELSKSLQRPKNFVGMHFFNPVPVMPLVEIIQSPESSQRATAMAVSYAVSMGKTPIVVKDCPGFLVNRILTAQFIGFILLIRDGADFEKIDQVMEDFGWPMGPAYLQDVIGMDTSSHVVDVITSGYPERMCLKEPNHVLALMAQQQRYGQKNGIGFYRYEKDCKGRLEKLLDGDTKSLIAQIQPHGTRDFSDQEIIERMMLPIIIESALCLEEGIASSAIEVDMSLILGTGFPRHWGGALKYADIVGINEIIQQCQAYISLGGCYVPTETMQTMAKQGQLFHSLS
ncbi:fatty acid oxidation complex subunit alpha FadB [Acinetobacter baumannii]|uniref:fatty acid oxidation complex subunit alpha FadB n=1 Tax=Acinetobacter baumannii TaxID=470 RepID=UPI0029565370|nr:fatty acid oxidation complex subunit alpha FadB [Acinetobacter baumannii]MDV7609576.1 fatty acid oxidation complex subunit alpha FadB [Acinetobacter baumannii]MDV7611367.1 fatty acid oxidation complex subunit alpha FadB [Acinetobacter baumannii]MDV7615568.1 fatty acid oxidation complex subunit alpha FadB [Acinetobacter baumannii]